MKYSKTDFRSGKILERLTKREIEVLRLMALGKTNSEIASDLCISYYTAKCHTCSIFYKLEVKDRVQAAVMAVREGIV